MLSATALVAQKQPFAPAGSNWKYWYADEYTTGYIKVVVVNDDVPITGKISGTDEEITVNCSEIYSVRAHWSHASKESYEEQPVSEYSPENFRYMFKEGNKAYIYDKFDQTFYKLIDMDAQPGDTWEMSCFNGQYNSVWHHVEFTHNKEAGVPAELLPYFDYYHQTCITDQNWACYLDNQYFKQALLNNGITQEQVDQWKAENACVTTGESSAGAEHQYYELATSFLTEKNYNWTPETWACDLKYYHNNIEELPWGKFGFLVKKEIFSLCEARMNILSSPMPMPTEIVNLWDKVDSYSVDDGIVNNLNFKLITKHNWPRYIDNFMADKMKKTVEEGGLGLTEDEIKENYTVHAKHFYTKVPVPGDVDLIQVAERRDVIVDGKTVPVIQMSPACESLLDSRAIRSKVSVYGALNIDYLNVYGEPWPTTVDAGSTSSRVIMWHGLLCGANGELEFETSKLAEYFENGMVDEYKAGNVSCTAIKAPNFLHNAKSVNAESSGSNYELNSNSTPYQSLNNRQPHLKQQQNQGNQMVVNTVVHVIYNEDNSQSNVSDELVNEMIDEINKALSATNDQSNVNPAFEDAVGNPGIKLQLMTVTPDSLATNGIIRHKTNIDYFTIGIGSSVEDKYAFKFDNAGQPLSWDHHKYLNIYIADFNGKAQKGTGVGGFVTTPEVIEDVNTDEYTSWLKEQDTKYWSDWLNDKEGDAHKLDGLSLDYFSTFYAEDAAGDFRFKTAIHELGHYFGLRHTFAAITEEQKIIPPGRPVKVEVVNDDGFADTPLQYYKTTVYDDCLRMIYQCGELMQINNFMDYSLPCACMFTKEQAAFMRQFTLTLRPGVVKAIEVGITDVLHNMVNICPNPTTGRFKITMDSNKAFDVEVYNMSGQKLKGVKGLYFETDISLEGTPNGIYLVKISSQGYNTIHKVLKN